MHRHRFTFTFDFEVGLKQNQKKASWLIYI